MSKKVKMKSPISKGVAKVPVVIQLEALECGAASLTMILAYYGKWIPLEKARIDCGVSRDGSKASNVVKAAKKYGLEVEAYNLEPEELKEEGTFPCIIHWNFNHFVVLDGFKGNKAYLNDPARGNYSVPMNIFDECFTGVSIFFKPTEEFVPSGHKRSMWAFAGERIKGLKTPIAIAVISTVITALIGLITPAFNKVFYDRLLTNTNPNWFIPFIIGLGILYVIQILVQVITTMVNYRISGKMSTVGNLSYMWKILHLPMHFFSQRMVGDIHSRKDGNAVISETLVNTLAPLVINSAMMLIYLVIMVQHSFLLTAVGLATAVINFFISQFISSRRVNLMRVKAREEGKLASSTIAGIQMIETIKSSGAETGFFQKWAGNFAGVNAITQKFTKESLSLMIIPSILSQIASYAVIGIGVYLTINGQFTLGSITAFQGFFSSFMSPVNELISASQTIQEMRTDMERIEDVMNYPNDPNIVDVKMDDDASKLSGNISIKNVTFGYSPLDKPLIKDFSFDIKQGERIAFVGPSGSGKSTLSKLISGIHSPWSGEITFDGKRINEIDHQIFTGSLAVVDQDIVLFEDTIANNIKMWDPTIEDFEMILAAKDAEIHYDILAKEGGYLHKVVEGGKDFSGGQCQRLEIARVLAGDPSVIILDEATSALDAQTEYKVVNNIKNRGITCIIIAHRLSTIRDCDKIVVLDQGNVVEIGKHEDLIKHDGYYKQLITND